MRHAVGVGEAKLDCLSRLYNNDGLVENHAVGNGSQSDHAYVEILQPRLDDCRFLGAQGLTELFSQVDCLFC